MTKRFTERFTIRKSTSCHPCGYSMQYRKSIYDLQGIPKVSIEKLPSKHFTKEGGVCSFLFPDSPKYFLEIYGKSCKSMQESK
jgi:hypothetical protein